MFDFILTLFTLFTTPSDADALRRSAPSYLTIDTATHHLAAARIAGDVYDVDPDLLLAIAFYESRYQPDAVTREKSGKLSCGLMMVTMPLGDPCPPQTILGGYLAGAQHVREWLKPCRGDSKCAMRGYAGGYVGIKLCASQEASGSLTGACLRVEARRTRARWLRRLREAYSAS